MVGLGNVNNTSDASKPVSTATQTALDLKAPLASPTFTGTPLAPTPTAGDNTTKVATTAFVANAVSSASSGSYVNLTSAQTVAGAKTFSSPITVQSNTLKGDGSGSVRNVGLGLAVFNATVTGTWNTAMGAYAFERLTSGSNNTAIGNETLSFITTTSNNTGIGNRAIMNATGSNNTALGSNAAVQLVTGNNNLILGNSSGSQIANNSNLTSLSNSVLMGSGTRISANGGTNEIVIGYNAVGNGSHTIQLGNTSITNVKTSGTITAGAITIPNTDGTANQVLKTDGSGTLSWSTPASSGATNIDGLSDALVESSSIYLGKDPSSTTSNANYNVSVGISALNFITEGDNNVAVGFQSLYANTTGYSNTAIGDNVMRFNIDGFRNTAIGTHSLYKNTSGQNNVSNGGYSLHNNTTGSNSSAFGYKALYNSTGSNNTGIGYQAGDLITTGTNNVIIGKDANPSVNSATNQIVIGYDATGAGDNTVQLGNTSITNVKTSGTITAGAITIPNTDGTSGQVLATNGSGTLAWSATKITAGAPASSTATGTAGEIRYDASYIYICTAANIWARVAIAW